MFGAMVVDEHAVACTGGALPGAELDFRKGRAPDPDRAGATTKKAVTGGKKCRPQGPLKTS